MKFITLLCLLALTACSSHIIDMTPEPTQQKFDLSDNERDGVIKARDKCPDSNTGEQIDNYGCGSNTLHTVEHRLEVNFDIDAYEVKSEYISEIEKLANFMSEFPQVNVSIEGHTSIRGTAEYNKILSKKRAKAIKSILIEKFNIASDRITTIGYGFERLLVPGNDEYSHDKNRRIVAELSSDKSFPDMKWTIYSVDKEVE